MSFKEAAELAGKPIDFNSAWTLKRQASTKASINRPPESWGAWAGKLIIAANRRLLDDSALLDWLLKERGLTKQTAELFRLGWIPRNLFYDRAAWGLLEELYADGTPKKLLVPAGLLIPGPDRIRVRRSKTGKYGKYYVVPGSGNRPLIINADQPLETTPALIVESELDAILLSQELEQVLLVVATGSTSNGPSQKLIEDLKQRPFVLVSLDTDAAGGAAAWGKWMKVLENAVRTLVPVGYGKDHFEAHKNGLNLNLWIEAAYIIAANELKTT